MAPKMPNSKMASSSDRKARKPEAAPIEKNSAITKKKKEKKIATAKRRRLNARKDEEEAVRESDEDEEGFVAGVSSKTPIAFKKPTSFASRKRKRVKVSMMGLLSTLSEDEENPTDHAAQFAGGSTALNTWGAPVSKPLSAIPTRRRYPGFRALGFRRGTKKAFEKDTHDESPEEAEECTNHEPTPTTSPGPDLPVGPLK